MNSHDNVRVLTVLCRLLYHSMGTLLTNIRNLVWDPWYPCCRHCPHPQNNVWGPHSLLELERLPVCPPWNPGRSTTNHAQQMSNYQFPDAEDQIKAFSSGLI